MLIDVTSLVWDEAEPHTSTTTGNCLNSLEGLVILGRSLQSKLQMEYESLKETTYGISCQEHRLTLPGHPPLRVPEIRFFFSFFSSPLLHLSRHNSMVSDRKQTPSSGLQSLLSFSPPLLAVASVRSTHVHYFGAKVEG